jgi:cystathionine gamma-synthase/cystathionine gamma-lyase/cystathionine beta-lyase
MANGSGSIETTAVHGGERRPGPEGSVVFPIYQGTVYGVDEGTDYHDIKYVRLSSTPSQSYLHDKLAALEGAEAALATASGMAAITTTLMTLVGRGGHLLASDCLYGGTHDLLRQDAESLGWSCTFVDAQDPDSWSRGLEPNTRVFLLETITNPLMRVPPLDEVVRFARDSKILSVIDNTFATPVNFNPLAVGFDVCIHSATKYLNGHSDLVAGCVMGRGELIGRIRKSLNHFGGSLDPHAGFLLARGVKTLAVRLKAQNQNALALAEFLAGRDEVGQVNYAGLPGHPDHAQASRLLRGFGGMLSLRLKGGAAAVERFASALRIPSLAPSLGGVESLVTQPARTSHAGMDPEERRKMGVADDLVRVSCGIEATEDLVGDFRQALEGL